MKLWLCCLYFSKVVFTKCQGELHAFESDVRERYGIFERFVIGKKGK